MIIFKKLRYKNFLSSGNQFTEIDLNRDKTTLIVGENGSGKSTLLDALSYVLFNKSFRGVNKPELVNSVTRKNMVVEIEFNDYLIRRGIKPNIFEIWHDGKLINQDAALKDYQDILETSILKLKHKSFNQIVSIGSANFVPFMQLPAASRREVIEDFLDLEIFSVMNNLLKDKVQKNKNDIVDTDHQIQMTKSLIALQKNHLKTLEKNNEELRKDYQAQIDAYTVDNNNKEITIKETNDRLEVELNKIKNKDTIKKNIDSLKNIRQQIQTKKKKLEQTVSFYCDNDSCPTCNQVIDDDFRKQIKDDKKKNIEEIDAAIIDLDIKYDELIVKFEEMMKINELISELNRLISTTNHDISTNMKLILSLEQEIEKLNQRVDALDKERDDLNLLIEKINKLESDQEILSNERETLLVASTLLKDGGIKSRIIKQYIPIMNNLINKYLTAMDTFIQFELDENFNEKITSRNREESTYYSFSQGERMRIDLALLFTWRSIAKIRNSSTTNLLIMDEVLDGSMDMTGLDEFLRIMTELAKDSNVFVISHKEQMLDKFDSVIKFQKIKNFSRMVA